MVVEVGGGKKKNLVPKKHALLDSPVPQASDIMSSLSMNDLSYIICA